MEAQLGPAGLGTPSGLPLDAGGQGGEGQARWPPPGPPTGPLPTERGCGWAQLPASLCPKSQRLPNVGPRLSWETLPGGA